MIIERCKIIILKILILLFALTFTLNYVVPKNYALLSSFDSKTINKHTHSITTKKMFNGEKIVHFDLKGAPPKISYLLKFIPFIKTLGASGILLEYEDMFPYYEEIEGIRAYNAYTVSDITKIVRSAEKYNLTIIPLVQTFGHLEFVLKLKEYKHLRENEKNPEVLCPSSNVYMVLKKMIDQVIRAHPKIRYFHIGCDEVVYIGICSKCKDKMKRNKWMEDDLYFNHVRKIAEYIIAVYPKIRPIIWGDKITKKTENFILAHDIPHLVDVMLWNYKLNNGYPSVNDMFSYAQLFRNLWIASSFKGSNGINAIITNPVFHLQNNKAWMKIIQQWQDKIIFKGIVLTGWQRYDHFSVLCELLPVAVPSLAISLQYINNLENDNYVKLKSLLKCDVGIPLDYGHILDNKFTKSSCTFPGYTVFYFINILYKTLTDYKIYFLYNLRIEQFNLYNIIYNNSNPKYDLYEQRDFEKYLLKINELEYNIRVAMDEVYDNSTINEWIITYILPYQLHLKATYKILNDSFYRNTWPRRPLENNVTFINEYFAGICGPSESKGCGFLNLP